MELVLVEIRVWEKDKLLVREKVPLVFVGPVDVLLPPDFVEDLEKDPFVNVGPETDLELETVVVREKVPRV